MPIAAGAVAAFSHISYGALRLKVRTKQIEQQALRNGCPNATNGVRE
jgi:hypothetical protein